MSCPNVTECACPKKTCPNNNGDKSNRNHYEVLKNLKPFETWKVIAAIQALSM